ncbi:hypothetical protein [Phaffia rhodozyma]|uniref:Uncharacterized protein n=1 Tax=Phaffia rhodozyma TaxID=264483 RepID=A0A0F7SWK3_PHARH|nr:hypothetical protein [Phaffia rhodozyma]
MLSLSILSGQIPNITPLTPVSICTSSEYGTPSFSPLLPCKSLPIAISPDPQSLLWTPPVSPVASPDVIYSLANGEQERPLDVNDRTKMAWLMDLRTSESDTIKVAEIVLELFPPADMHSSEVSAGAYTTDLAEALRYWTSLTPHPYCILILTVCLLERFKAAHPSLIASGRISDTTLRVVFAAFLLTTKHVSEDSFHNTAFVSRTPWTCGEINSIEKELFARLDYNLYFSADEYVGNSLTGFYILPEIPEMIDKTRYMSATPLFIELYVFLVQFLPTVASMDTPTLEELQRTRTELDSRVNSLQLAMDNLRNEMNLLDQDDGDEGVDDIQQQVGSQNYQQSADTRVTDEGRQSVDTVLPSVVESDTSAELPVLSSALLRDPRPFDPVRLRRGQVSLLDLPPTSSAVELLPTTELRPPPSADELDRSYRNFVQDRLTLSSLSGLNGATDEGTLLSSSPSSPVTPFPLNGSNITRSQPHPSHLQPRRVLRSYSVTGFDSNSEYIRPNPSLRLSSSTSAPTSASTTRRILADRRSTRDPHLATQSAEEMLERVDETAMDLMDVRTSLQERSQSIRDLDGAPRVGILNETLRNGVDLIDQLEGRLGVVRNRLLRRGEFPRLELSPPSFVNNASNRTNARQNEDEVLLSASPDPIHPVPPILTSRSDTFSDWVTSRGMPASASTAIYAYSPFTSTDLINTSATPSGVATTEISTSSPLSSPASLSGDLSSLPSRHRLLFDSNMAYASPSSTAAASDRLRTMDPVAQLQEVRDRNNYMWRGGDDGMSFGEEIGGLRRSGWAERVIGGLGRRARQDRGGRRNRPWDLEGHDVNERGEEDWPDMTEADNQVGTDEFSLQSFYDFDTPQDLSRANLFARSASDDPAVTVSLPNQTLRRELLLSGQATLLSSSRQGDQGSSLQHQALPPLTLSSTRASYNAASTFDLSAMPSTNHPVRLPTRRFEVHSFPDRSSIDPSNPLIVADRIHEDILLCEHRRIAAAAEAQRKKEEDEKKAGADVTDWMRPEGEYGEELEEEWVVRPGPVDLPDLWAESPSAVKLGQQKLTLVERGVKRPGEEMRKGGTKVILIEAGMFVGR